jgi:Oxidoreductase molybdopterin binding domain
LPTTTTAAAARGPVFEIAKHITWRSVMIVRVLFAALLLAGGGSSPLSAACPGGPSTSFTVTGEVAKPTVFDLSNLEQLPAAQTNVTYFAAGSVVTQSFTGALLWDLLNNPPVGSIVVAPTVKNDILHKIVIVTGSDCYQSVFGAGEFDPFFGGSQIMVAYAVGGQSLGQDGFARIVVPGDKAGGRFVSNIVNIDVEDASSFPITPPRKPHW